MSGSPEKLSAEQIVRKVRARQIADWPEGALMIWSSEIDALQAENERLRFHLDALQAERREVSLRLNEFARGGLPALKAHVDELWRENGNVSHGQIDGDTAQVGYLLKDISERLAEAIAASAALAQSSLAPEPGEEKPTT